jgi:hypothetical protein
MELRIKSLEGLYGICRLDSTEPVPAWASRGEFSSVSRSTAELSVVCVQRAIPDNVRCDRDWRVLQVEGPLDFALVGILADLSSILACAGISLFAVSTFDTDYLLVHEVDFTAAVRALREAGHAVDGG